MTPIQRFWRNSALNLGFWAISVVSFIVFGPKWGSQAGLEAAISFLFSFVATVFFAIQVMGILGMIIMTKEAKRRGRRNDYRS